MLYVRREIFSKNAEVQRISKRVAARSIIASYKNHLHYQSEEISRNIEYADQKNRIYISIERHIRQIALKVQQSFDQAK